MNRGPRVGLGICTIDGCIVWCSYVDGLYNIIVLSSLARTVGSVGKAFVNWIGSQTIADMG